MPREPKGAGATASERARTGTAGQTGTADQMEYVADLLAELQRLATLAGHETLAGLLGLSRSEALRQAKAEVGKADAPFKTDLRRS